MVLLPSLAIVLGASAFSPRLGLASRARCAVRMQDDGGGFKLPELPKITLPKIEIPGIEVFGPAGTEADARQRPGDVRFTDRDGDVITLRKAGGRRVDYYVGAELRMAGARLEADGASLKLSGTVKKSTGFFNFEMEEQCVDKTTPSDPDAVAVAMALVT